MTILKGYKDMRKALSLVLLLACLFAAACSSEAKELNCTVDELFAKINSANAEGEMYPYNADRLTDDLSITPELYSEGYFMIPMESAGVETIAFFKATNAANAKTIKSALDRFVNDTKVYQEKYNADNYAVACSAVTKTEGVYVYLVMSPKKSNIVKIINENLK